MAGKTGLGFAWMEATGGREREGAAMSVRHLVPRSPSLAQL